MGDILGPYGRDHQSVLDWAWQTWPLAVRARHSAGCTEQAVALVKRHVQCEIDVRYSSCALLSLCITPPLVFRPWCIDNADDMKPWVMVMRVGRDHGTKWLTETPRATPRVYEDLLTRGHFEQITV